MQTAAEHVVHIKGPHVEDSPKLGRRGSVVPAGQTKRWDHDEDKRGRGARARFSCDAWKQRDARGGGHFDFQLDPIFLLQEWGVSQDHILRMEMGRIGDLSANIRLSKNAQDCECSLCRIFVRLHVPSIYMT